MQVHGQHTVDAGHFKHVGHDLGADGDPLSLREDFEALRAAWQLAVQAPTGLNADGTSVYDAVNEKLGKLVGSIGLCPPVGGDKFGMGNGWIHRYSQAGLGFSSR